VKARSCALAILAVLIAAGAARATSEPHRPPNVVLVVVDTLRADRLGCYGNPRALTPAIDALGARGAVFRRAYAQSSWTLPSVGSIMTSRMPFEHGGVLPGTRVNDDNVTLAEALRAHGYVTGAFVANPLVNAVAGFGQGFDVFDVPVRTNPHAFPIARAGIIDTHAADWLAKRALARDGSPFFLYLHYMEPHPPYGRTDKLRRLLGGRPAPDLGALSQAYMLSRTYRLTREQLADVQDVYDAEIAQVDDAIAWIVRSLDKLRMLDDTVIVFTADHGEEFMDHGGTSHGWTLYDEVLHVPLLIAAPGKGRVDVDETVALVDVAPTVLELAGIPAPAGYEGHSLAEKLVPPGRLAAVWQRMTARFREPGVALSHLAGPGEHPEPANALRAAVRGFDKAIAVGPEPVRYYDLAADPHETTPVNLPPAERAALDHLLDDLRERERPIAPAVPAIDPSTRDQLHALGYVQ
jgi:arylsulfatase A-like enzyme